MGEGIGGAKKERRHSLQKSKAMMNLHSKHSKQRNKMCGRASNVKGNLRWLETEEWFKTGEAKHTKKNHTWTKRNRLTGSSDSLQLAPPLCSGCPAWRKAHPLCDILLLHLVSPPVSIFYRKPLPAPLLLHSASMASLTTSMADLDLLLPPIWLPPAEKGAPTHLS